MRNDQTATIFARPHMPITTFNAFSQQPRRYIPIAISNLLLPGLTLLTGPTHSGKTALALQLMHAVATGELPFGEDLRFQPMQERVLYLALDHSEDHLHTLQERLAAAHQGFIVPGNIHFTNTWGPLTPDEGLHDLEMWFTTQTEDTRLLVIDNLDTLRPLFRGKDRDLLALLRRMAERFRISVLLLHTCKSTSPLIDYADHHLHLKPLSIPDYCQLEVVGASLRRESYLLHSTPEQVAFRLLGGEDILALDTLSARKILSRERLKTLALFHKRGGSLSPAEVAEALDYDPVNARQLLHGMVRVRLLRSPAFGSYEVHPDLRAILPHLLERILLAETEMSGTSDDQSPQDNQNSVDTIAHTSTRPASKSIPAHTSARTPRTDIQQEENMTTNRAMRRHHKQKRRR